MRARPFSISLKRLSGFFYSLVVVIVDECVSHATVMAPIFARLTSRMGQETPTTKDLAALVFSSEVGVDSTLDQLRPGVQRTFQKLNVHLSARFGTGGYQALIKRALSLATTDYPWLASIRISENGNVEGFEDLTQFETVRDGCLAIFARLIEMLDTLIGRNLTARILQSAWPDSVPTGKAGRQGDSNG